MGSKSGTAFAPGARVVIRDEEWTVRAVKQASFGGEAVDVVGNSELVRGKEATFLTALDTVRVLRPEDTALVVDTSPRYRRSRLYLESLLRRTPVTEQALCVGHRGAMRLARYQLVPAFRALGQLRPRLLIADGVGMGKTIEVGVLLSELIRRGRGRRILVVTLKSILAQFQEELWARFTIPLVRLDSVGIQRVQARVPSNMNPFYFYDRVIISVDTLKKDEKYRRYLENAHWDVAVVDECQHIAVRTPKGGSRKSQRARLGQLLASHADALILTSATPHDGRPQSFASLINLLEPTAVANEDDYTAKEVADLFVRRFKKDVADEVQEEFRERVILTGRAPASTEEDAVFAALEDATFRTIGRTRNGTGVLFQTLLKKAFLSSPDACRSTIDQRLGHAALRDAESPDASADRAVLTHLRDLVSRVTPAAFSKYQGLLRTLHKLGFDRPESAERVVVFTERIATLDFLQARLTRDLGASKDRIAVFHGTLDDQKQKDLVKSFGTEQSPIRILLASDAASEGVNLHYFCHRLVHFDLPWSLMTLEQRNGRIDRFGQKHRPELTHLLTVPGVRKTLGDIRILERLIEKENEASKNLGDVAWLMDLHDPELEEEEIGKGMEAGKAPDEIIPDEPRHTDLLELLLGAASVHQEEVSMREPLRLFPDDLAYTREAVHQTLEETPEGTVEWLDHASGLILQPPEDLRLRYAYLPPELRRNEGGIRLTADRKRVMDALDAARETEGRWPEWELLWELHPVCTWLDDRVLAAFTRHEAPVLRLTRGIAPSEVVLVFQGQISNHRSQPIIADWFGVGFRGGRPDAIHPLRDLVARTGLDAAPANPGTPTPPSVIKDLQALIPDAVFEARRHLETQRQDRATVIRRPLLDGQRALLTWRDKRLAALDAREAHIALASGPARRPEQRRLAGEREHVERLYAERRAWVEEGMRTVPEPYLRLAAVLIPNQDP
jgi:superfamily II DNA or RNA helicase